MIRKSLTLIFRDTCAFYPPQETEKEAVFKIDQMYKRGEIMMMHSHYVEGELSKAPPEVQIRRNLTIYSDKVDQTEHEITKTENIKKMLFGDKNDIEENELIDVRNLFEASKFGCRFFVTTDKVHILSKRDRILEMLNMQVVLPSEMLEILDKMPE